MHAIYPEIKLSHTKEDECDACVAIEIELHDPTLTEERRMELVAIKNTHIEEAVIQRRAMSAFVSDFVQRIDPSQVLPREIIPDFIDEENITKDNNEDDQNPNVVREVSFYPGLVTVQLEDMGGGLPMPFYGFTRPSSDYYNSNLMQISFITADVSANTNYIKIYDERTAVKGADALCSLRMRYYLMKQNSAEPKPEISLSVCDNCVGQNKSQDVMMFNAMLSLCFYKKVVVCF